MLKEGKKYGFVLESLSVREGQTVKTAGDESEPKRVKQDKG
jgi:hypothetical protein